MIVFYHIQYLFHDLLQHREIIKNYILNSKSDNWQKKFNLSLDFAVIYDIISISELIMAEKFLNRLRRRLSKRISKIESVSLNRIIENQQYIKLIMALLILSVLQVNYIDALKGIICFSGPPQQYLRKSKQLIQHEFGAKPEDWFLWNIQYLESSGGRNIKHKIIGQTHITIGRWGLKKPTINDIIIRFSHNLSPHIHSIRHMSFSDTERYLQNYPEIELELARALARHVLNVHRGDVYRAAYAWRHGHNLSPHRISDDQLLNSGYIRKFRELSHINPFKKFNLINTVNSGI